MADDKGKTDFGQHSGQNEKPKEGLHYADQMWKKIEQKSDLKEKREELKQEFPDRPKKRRRKRHRRRRGGEQKFERKPELKTEPKVEVAPINPFDTGGKYDKYPEAELPKSGFSAPINPFLKPELPPTEPEPKVVEPEPQVVKPEPVQQEPELVPVNPFEKFSKKEVRETLNPDVQEVYDTVDTSPKEPSVETDVIDVEPVETEPVYSEALVDSDKETSEGDFKEDFWTILEQAGITKKRILIFGIVLVVIILGIIVFFSFGGDDEPIDREDAEEETDEIPLDGRDGGNLVGIISAYIFGLEHAVDDFTPIVAEPITDFGNVSGMEAGFIFGKMGQDSQESFVSYIDLLRRMENLYNTDVYNLVNLAVDRRAALNVHLIEMDSAINEGLAVYELLRQQLEVLDLEYEKYSSQRDLYENAFFEDITALRGQDSYYKLGLFTEFSQTALKIKAEYNAKRVVRDMLVNALNILRPRYEDISTNAEALIKGVKVFDLPDSDIDAIILP